MSGYSYSARKSKTAGSNELASAVCARSLFLPLMEQAVSNNKHGGGSNYLRKIN
uniref:Uncharacterized protein n=1 Tax=Anguilla anguilla TaxID=7936 RepID=A0A0E9V299_ANGAN